jgi:hypothetical protein
MSSFSAPSFVNRGCFLPFRISLLQVILKEVILSFIAFTLSRHCYLFYPYYSVSSTMAQETLRQAFPDKATPLVSSGIPYTDACVKHVDETFKASRVYTIA